MTTCRYRTGRQVPVLLAPLCADTVLDPGWFHLLLLESGCFRGRTGNTTYVAAGHSLLCLPPDSAFRPLEIRHSSGLHLAFAPEFINVGLHAPALHPSCYEMIRETQGYPDFRVFADDPGILGLDDAAYAYMRKSLERIRVQLEEQPDPKWSCRARQILFRILAVLAQGREREDCAAGTEETAGRVCRYILTHLGEDLSVGSLCRTFATNHTSLYRQFKAHTGLPVSEYVLSKRLEAAKSSLAFTSLSLAEIAASSGISRQGVWDNIRRADAALRDTEARLGLVRRFAAQRAAAAALEDTLTKLRDTVGGDARPLAEQALRQLQDLKG